MSEQPEPSALPPLTYRRGSWEGADVLPSWAGFQSRQGAYNALSSAGPSDGRVHVFVEPPDTGDQDSPPAPEQHAAYRFLKANEPGVAAAVLDAILREYPTYRGYFNDDYADDDTVAKLPAAASPADLRPLIGLGIVHVLDVAKDDCAYLGFEFGCAWDDEHGLGVLTHRDRVLEVGAADAAFSAWPSERDGSTSLRPTPPPPANNQPAEPPAPPEQLSLF